MKKIDTDFITFLVIVALVLLVLFLFCLFLDLMGVSIL